MSYPAKLVGNNFATLQAGTTAGATASTAAVANKRHNLLVLSGWSDTASLVQVKDDTTVIFETKVAANAGFQYRFDPPLIGTLGKKMDVAIASSTAACSVLAQGVTTT